MTAHVPEPRLSRGNLRDVGLPIWVFSRLAGKVSGTEPPAVFLTLGRNRGLFWGWLHFAGRLMPGGRLPRRETELVILRVAATSGSAYEWQQHAGLGRKAGLSESELDALALVRKISGSQHGWCDRDRMLLDVTDELLGENDLGDATWVTMRSHLDERTSVELLMLVGHYRMLATTLQALRVQPDARRD